MNNDRAAEIEITQEMILEGLRALPYLPSEMLGIQLGRKSGIEGLSGNA